MTPSYLPEWTEQNPTVGLTETAARAYWKAHQVAGDCRFALRPGAMLPASLRAAWQALQASIDGRAEKTTDRTEVARLRAVWRVWQDAAAHGRFYDVAMAIGPVRVAPQPIKRVAINWEARARTAEGEVARLRQIVADVTQAAA